MSMLDNYWTCTSTKVTEKVWRGIQWLGVWITENVRKITDFSGVGSHSEACDRPPRHAS